VTMDARANGLVGEVTVAAGADVPVTGLEATGSVGSVTCRVRVNVEVTGVEGTGEVGAVTVVAKANAVVTGVSATGEVGTPLVWGRIVPNQNPVILQINRHNPLAGRARHLRNRQVGPEQQHRIELCPVHIH
jgi:hypothetical protein